MSILRRFSPQVQLFTKRSFKSLKFPGESLDEITSPYLIHGIHVFHCPDEVGIVAKLSECIASRGGNILYADVFVPEKKNVFYSRSEFVFDPVKWTRMQMDEDFLKLSKMFNAMTSVVRVPSLDPKYKIAVLASKQDHCLVDLLHGWQDGRLPVHITAVIRDTDFLVLARYMQILSGNFLSSYGKDIINIHHGLLPSFKGGNPSKQAFDYGVKLIGATSHFVTQELDGGTNYRANG
ncbi:Formyltetrahydrofolate deformylase 2 [Forsythia ovata]|uniref:Formyltetrahydrofolate deformylase 2 n=1 Tax=Forsythia ovata TaxID=205694 RepID=A0ABD1S801_9LAMI